MSRQQCGLIGILIVLALPAFADDVATLESVTVTAQRFEQSLQDVPIAITAIDRQDMQRNRITTVGEVLGATPSITIAPYVNSTNTFFIYMRGIGMNDPGQIGTDGSVGLYQDGFYISRPQGVNFDLSDIDRVEVLRGPQGTLYGRNTMGGAVNMISRAPSGEAGFRQELELGNLNYYRALSVIDLPAWNSLSAKVSLLARSLDGSIADPGQPNGFGADTQRGAKLQLRWAPGGAVSADYFVDYATIESTANYGVNTAFNGDIIVPGIPYVASVQRPTSAYRSINLPLSDTRSSMQGLTFTWLPNANLTVRSLTGYRWLNADTYQNYNEIFGLQDFASHNVIPDHQFSQEMQAVGQMPSLPLTFVAGIYHFNENAWNHLDGGAAGLGVYSMIDENEESQSNAIYGQTTWTANSRVELTVGVRYTHDSKHGARTRINLLTHQAEIDALSELHYGRFTPSLTTMVRLSQDASIYFRAASGYKSGAPNADAPIGGYSLAYGPESLVSYELGLKSLWFERRARLNVALFQTNYKDQQRAIQVAPTVDDFYAFNVGRETFWGAELELAVSPLSDLSLSLNYALLIGRIDELNAPAHTIFDPAVNPYSPYHVGEDISGLFDPSQGYAPRNSINAAVDYVLLHFARGEISTNLNYRWESSRQGVGADVPGSEFAVAPAFGLLGSSLALHRTLANGQHLTISLWGRNLLNSKAAAWVNGFGSIVPVSATPAGYTGSIIVGWQEPRRYGISATYQL
jgi:iron complex outermembrane recepter protein